MRNSRIALVQEPAGREGCDRGRETAPGSASPQRPGIVPPAGGCWKQQVRLASRSLRSAGFFPRAKPCRRAEQLMLRLDLLDCVRLRKHVLIQFPLSSLSLLQQQMVRNQLQQVGVFFFFVFFFFNAGDFPSCVCVCVSCVFIVRAAICISPHRSQPAAAAGVTV